MSTLAEFAWDYTPKQGELGRHDQSFERWCAQAQDDWARHFPVRRGYVLLALPLPNDAAGVRLSALRGDFRADLDLRWDPDLWSRDPSVGSLAVRCKAQSKRLAQAEDRAVAWSNLFASSRAWLAPLMFVLGSVCILAAATLSHLVLVGFLSFCVAAFLSYAGVWRDHIRGYLTGRAWSAMLADIGAQGDLRRWRALGMAMDRRRKALAQQSPASPFRRVQTATAHPTRLRPAT